MVHEGKGWAIFRLISRWNQLYVSGSSRVGQFSTFAVNLVVLYTLPNAAEQRHLVPCSAGFRGVDITKTSLIHPSDLLGVQPSGDRCYRGTRRCGGGDAPQHRA